MAKRKRKNKERSRPHSESILLRLPPDQYARLQALSDGRGENVQAIIQFALAETLPDLEMALEKARAQASQK